MNVSVERLRVWLLAGAGLLVIVIASFLGYAHYRAHRFLTNLPKKLGVNVRRETNGFTYSQSVQGRTIYTVHAAKAVERADGKVTLHDVGIVLYGRKEDRADRIYGKEFEYDQKNEVIRADGEVHIDLQAPEAADANAKMDYAAGKDLHGAGTAEAKDVRLIHVTTSGLVFLQKLGVAATDNEIEFESGGLTGHAVGADYNSDTGVVVLHSAVRVNGLERDRPVVLTASRAELDRQNERAMLTQAKYMAVGGKGGAEQTAQARNVVVHLRPDGTAERIEAEGEVTLMNGMGGVVAAPRGEMTLSAQSQPQSVVMLGGVKYSVDEPLRQAKGEAEEGRAGFDKAGRPEHVVMTGAVHLNERIRTDASGEAWGERELNAGQVELALLAGAAGKEELRDAKATGDARLKVMNPAAKGGGPTSSALAGDVLTAHFVRVGSANHLAEVHGDGHTAMRRVNGKGVVDTSSGDSLVAHFRPVSAGAARGANATGIGQGADEITSATEQGHVVMTELPVKKPGDSAAPVEERLTAEKAIYDGELERTTLTGSVQASNGTSVLWADRVVTEQQTGDATADGSVKASFSQVGSAAEPVHVLALRAELKHDSQVAKFYGAGANGKPARLWQGASQVDAPVIEFEQKQKRLLAHGVGQGAPGAVHTVLVSAGTGVKTDSAKTGKQAADGKQVGGKAGVVRVISRDLVYSDEARRADFTGGVQVDSADGTMRGQQAVVYLQAAPANGGKKADGAAGGGFMGGNVERVVASGHIEMQQPGRRASGEQLVYMASDGMFVLTGTPTALPKVVDDQRGTVTGTSLRFHSGDENVVVSNEGESGAGQRVRTETRVKNKE
ncbi:LptA/OstA family protein [Tunturibacter empetritectus]|uniref:Lipopolysaccharide export system protein LptA n=1 Tax=Tunturiibacter lichenicola TaxID=2051959 RepID=A0A7W8N1U1_9BACT|nr:LptA/OstA family protein [Edaphobacter lichenicola]MBB5342662.1 lipopolysaccharide export system protein LptA [Edaphobacter lichenicola]